MFRNIGTNKEAESEWVSISDMMSVLMMIFLFISISYMYNVQQQQLNIKKVAVAYQELQTDLYSDLWNEFKEDLPVWRAVIEKETLSIRFEEPEVLFRIGSSELTDTFKSILNNFFPRYIKIISTDRYQNNIEEIRIEGHTSSEWDGETCEIASYINNMMLSQNRTRTVLEYCLKLITTEGERSWSIKHITANGLSSSQLVSDEKGSENRKKSRRVEFRTKTNAERKVVEIIERMENI